MEQTVDRQLTRTLAIVRQLARGKRLHLPDGSRIAMGQDYTIGLIYEIRGKDTISPLAEMTFSQLNTICEKHRIGPIIPERKKPR